MQKYTEDRLKTWHLLCVCYAPFIECKYFFFPILVPITHVWYGRYLLNRPFPSSLVPLFQSESKCETILMKMTSICMKMKLRAELIFIWKVSHLDSFWNRDTRELGNGLFWPKSLGAMLEYRYDIKRGLLKTALSCLKGALWVWIEFLAVSANYF